MKGRLTDSRFFEAFALKGQTSDARTVSLEEYLALAEVFVVIRLEFVVLFGANLATGLIKERAHIVVSNAC